MSDEDVAIAIASELARIDGFDPDDANGGLYDLRWSGGPTPEPEGDDWEIDYLPKGERIARALESFAKRGVVVDGDEAVAVDFYSRNPSAALVDFTNRVAPPAQAVSVPEGFTITRIRSKIGSPESDYFKVEHHGNAAYVDRTHANIYALVSALAASPAAATKEGK